MDRWPLLECAQPHAPFLSAKLTHHAPGTHKTHIRRWCVIKCVFFLRVFNRCPSAEIAEPFFSMIHDTTFRTPLAVMLCVTRRRRHTGERGTILLPLWRAPFHKLLHTTAHTHTLRPRPVLGGPFGFGFSWQYVELLSGMMQ